MGVRVGLGQRGRHPPANGIGVAFVIAIATVDIHRGGGKCLLFLILVMVMKVA